MSTHLAASPHTYRESSVLTASRERLVVMLYDGACRFLEQGAAAMRAGDIGGTHVKLRRGEAIISYLQNTLDMEQGDIPRNLLTIYLFCRRHLNRARVERDPKKVEDVIRLLRQLREAWDAICPG
ncbi:MAG: flagellar export chaperone FliS [Solirubrobacteraceae bacterium]